ncbi:hypothetical protein CARUB_v10026327mg [Capsella rubella]|uniref:Stress up-regulated Nod 19 n=2 Tax=Capsella rubella TaxID=81985 RepID=R0G9P4_9BRAS|nr:uncharacterized protein LOC17877005 isoform X2 [Capsella rubella]EOA13299.1 hypothetical protein CARUB_v10026327mg [Capsella rubella]
MARNHRRSLIFFFVLSLLALTFSPSLGSLGTEKKIKSAIFFSPKLVMNPGSVSNSYLFDIDFPRGHIGLKSFDAQVVDEAGKPVPLHETYLHHWIVEPYYVRKGSKLPQQEMFRNHGFQRQDPRSSLGSSSDIILVKNGGLCRGAVLRHYFGSGSETRKTSTYIPDPYAVEIDNPEERPEGYEFKWLLNIHAIDTRGAEDKTGCIECLCDLYNVTIDEYGRAIGPGYKGGLYCCYDKTQCRVKSGFDNGEKTRTLFLKYTVRWVDWDNTVLPAKIYILDVTDSWKKTEGSIGDGQEHHCHVEYEVKPCKTNGDGCIDVKKKSLMMPFNGYIVYSVAHQHAGGIGAALYRENGEGICTSIPKYGNGVEPGNEAGYIVGMSSCYPADPVKVDYGETFTLEVNYSNVVGHTGVMGLFYIVVSQQLPEPESSLPNLFQAPASSVSFLAFLAVTVVVAVVVLISAVIYRRQNREDGYQSLST